TSRFNRRGNSHATDWFFGLQLFGSNLSNALAANLLEDLDFITDDGNTVGKLQLDSMCGWFTLSRTFLRCAAPRNALSGSPSALLTVILSVISLIYLPASPISTKIPIWRKSWFNGYEEAIMVNRTLRDNPTKGLTALKGPRTWKDVKSVWTDHGLLGVLPCWSDCQNSRHAGVGVSDTYPPPGGPIHHAAEQPIDGAVGGLADHHDIGAHFQLRVQCDSMNMEQQLEDQTNPEAREASNIKHPGF
ncbi:hypothetical protein S7711_03642, partial [Stachybotrys chartarum IBT 7711]